MPRPGNSNHSTEKQPLVVHQDYADWTVEQLQVALKPKDYDFARAYLNNNANQYKAYREAVWDHNPKNIAWAKGKTPTEIAQKINGAPRRILNKPLVSAYIVKFQEERRAELAKRDRFGYEQWIERMNSLSEGAEAAEQYSPAIRAQELIGKAAGHIDSNRADMASRMADTELSSKLADILGTQTETLSRALQGVSQGSAIDAEDAEVIEPGALPDNSD